MPQLTSNNDTSRSTIGRFLRLKQVEEKVGFKRSTIFRLMDKGNFPSSIRLFGNMAVWPENKIEEWMQEQLATAEQTQTPVHTPSR